MSPMMATRSPSSDLPRSRMVRASSSAWVGCSCVPSPALMMGISRWRCRKCGAPEAAWRMMIASGRMAASVFSVSTSDSPFDTLEACAVIETASAPRPFRGDFKAGAGASGGSRRTDSRSSARSAYRVCGSAAPGPAENRGARSRMAWISSRVRLFDAQQARHGALLIALFPLAALSPCRRFPETSLR